MKATNSPSALMLGPMAWTSGTEISVNDGPCPVAACPRLIVLPSIETWSSVSVLPSSTLICATATSAQPLIVLEAGDLGRTIAADLAAVDRRPGKLHHGICVGLDGNRRCRRRSCRRTTPCRRRASIRPTWCDLVGDRRGSNWTRPPFAVDRAAVLVGDRGIVEGDGAIVCRLDHAAVLVLDHGAFEKHRALLTAVMLPALPT